VLVAVFFSTTVTAGIWAYTATAQVAMLSGQVASAAAAHRKALFKAKAKGRLRRMLVAVPIIGAGAAVAFESRDYQRWKKENADGTPSDYACEVYTASVEVMDEVLQDLPEKLRPSRDTVEGLLPNCDTSES
jgi:hypothetical protein